MEFSELVKVRQSVRKYTDQPVEQEKIMKCLETARLSPSANNAQPWKFVVVDDPVLLKQMAGYADSLGMNKFTHEVPVIIAVVLEKPGLMSKMGSAIKDKEYPLMDIGIAVNQFCLQATELGLGTCIIGWFDEKKIIKLLQVDRSKRIPLLISLGYPGTPVRNKIRKPLDVISSWNRY